MSKIKERPQEIINLQAGLLSLFKGMLPESASGNDSEKERNFLSRAIAAYTLHKEATISLKDSATMVVDGGSDGGIDAIFYNSFISTLYLVQSKYFHDGTGIPELGDVSKFASGVRSLLNENLSPFLKNNQFQKRKAEIEKALRNSDLKVVVLLAYSGINLLEADQTREMDALVGLYPIEDASLSWKSINLATLHDWLTQLDEQQGVDHVKIQVHAPGWLQKPHEMVYGKVALKDIKALHQEHGDALIAGNIRAFQGATNVNEAIAETLKTQPENFLYLNNGVTAYCARMEMSSSAKINHDLKEVTAHRFSIVNGAQTVGVISRANDDLLENGYVFVRLVSLERMEDDTEFAKRITTTTNFQNQVQQRDLSSVEPEQRAIAETLHLAGVRYDYKKVGGIWPAPTHQSFTSDEALVASACMQPFGQGDLCAALVANPDSLWKNDDGDEAKGKASSYHRVFSPLCSPRMIWRGVQAMRVVLQAEEAIATDEIRLAEFYDLQRERFLVLYLVFHHLHPERGEAIYLSNEESQAIRDWAEKAYSLVNQVIEEHYQNSLQQRLLLFRRPIDTEGKLKRIFETPSGCKFCWAKVMAMIQGKGKTN